MMDLKTKLDPSYAALLVIDIQNDFCASTGMMASMGKDVSGMPKLVKGISSLIATCEAVGIPTMYTQQIYDIDKLNELQREQYDLDGKLITCDIRGEGWKFYNLEPPASAVYQKYNYNVFSNDRLVRDLKSKKTKTLIITGVSTQICVETAIRNGFDMGYKIVVPEDLTATTSKDGATKERTLNLVRKTYGVVTSSEEIAATLLSYKY